MPVDALYSNWNNSVDQLCLKYFLEKLIITNQRSYPNKIKKKSSVYTKSLSLNLLESNRVIISCFVFYKLPISKTDECLPNFGSLIILIISTQISNLIHSSAKLMKLSKLAYAVRSNLFPSPFGKNWSAELFHPKDESTCIYGVRKTISDVCRLGSHFHSPCFSS